MNQTSREASGLTILIWTVTWGLVGAIYSFATHAHAWTLLPIVGVLYGVIAGGFFVFVQGRVLAEDLTPIIGIGMVASSLAGVILSFVFGFKPLFALLFFPVSGALTVTIAFGLIRFVGFFSRRGH